MRSWKVGILMLTILCMTLAQTSCEVARDVLRDNNDKYDNYIQNGGGTEHEIKLYNREGEEWQQPSKTKGKNNNELPDDERFKNYQKKNSVKNE